MYIWEVMWGLSCVIIVSHNWSLDCDECLQCMGYMRRTLFGVHFRGIDLISHCRKPEIHTVHTFGRRHRPLTCAVLSRSIVEKMVIMYRSIIPCQS